ncbi:hypothetical protein MASR2M39_04880 [Ignavibacteriales bacterium]
MGKHGTFLKRFTDIIVSSLVLLISSPVILISVVAIRIESRGAAFFLQDRTGLGRSTFKLVKLRGMVQDAEQLGSSFTEVDDPRLTRVGKILRRLSIDEIPNFINVLKGEMSVVGPRPDVPEVTDLLPDDLASVFNFKPGVTGIAQINGRQTLTFEERSRIDVEYYPNATFFSDLMIIFRTPLVIISNKGNI